MEEKYIKSRHTARKGCMDVTVIELTQEGREALSCGPLNSRVQGKLKSCDRVESFLFRFVGGLSIGMICGFTISLLVHFF